jgi:hypothetical protein
MQVRGVYSPLCREQRLRYELDTLGELRAFPLDRARGRVFTEDNVGAELSAR